MTKPDDGGPAFQNNAGQYQGGLDPQYQNAPSGPGVNPNTDDIFKTMSRLVGLNVDDIQNEINNRMSLRDWFAGQSITAAKSNLGGFNASVIAELAYELADAMLKERSKEALK